MTAERWERIKEIFDSALDHPASQRDSFVQAACSNDEEMRNEVVRLLEEHDRVGTFLQQPALVPRDALVPGDIVAGRYKVVRILGRGGMGEVYEAHDRFLNETIALKTLRAGLASDHAVLRRFQREIQLARKVTHTNVCRVFEAGVHESSDRTVPPVHYFTMELLEGETLSERIKREGRLSAAEAFPLIRQISAGLQAAHEAGIVHRDFKSANVIISGGRAVITDFGLAHLDFSAFPQGSTITAASHLAGTVGYMSPEQLSGDPITTASDIYSFGIVLFEMASGRLPFTEHHIIQSAIQRVTGGRPDIRVLVPDIDSLWANVIDRCLDHKPELRFAAIGEIVQLFRGNEAGRFPTKRLKVSASLLRKAAIVSAIVLVLVSLFLWSSRLRQQGLQNVYKIMLPPTVNATGEDQFNGLTPALRAALDQSHRFTLWDNARLSSTLSAMRRNPADNLPAKDWREIAFREVVPFLVFSTLSRVGSSYALTIHCEQIGTAPDPPVRSWDRTFTSDGPNGLFEAIHAASAWVRKTAGETETELFAHNRLPQDITSASWEALGLFDEAEQLRRANKPAGAIPLLRRAIQLDSQFAMALMRLGDLLVAQRNDVEGYQYWREAIKQGRAQHLSDREHFRIETRYQLEIGDFAAAEPVLREWIGKFPNDPLAAEWLPLCLLELGRYPEVIAAARNSREQFGAALFTTSRIIMALAMSGRLAEIPAELTVLKQLPEPAWELRFRGTLSALREDYDSAEASFSQLANMTAGQEASRATSLLAALSAERGNLDRAALLLREGIAHDRKAGEHGLASQKASALAFIENIRGNRQESRAWALESVSMLASPQIVQQAASVLARQGFLKDAEIVSARIPAGEGPKYEVHVLRMRGEILAAKKDYETALAVLERAAKMESALRPKEYVARVLAMSGQNERARLIYSEIVDTPWLVWGSPESEWPGIRLLSKRYLHSMKGE